MPIPAYTQCQVCPEGVNAGAWAISASSAVTALINYVSGFGNPVPISYEPPPVLIPYTPHTWNPPLPPTVPDGALAFVPPSAPPPITITLPDPLPALSAPPEWTEPTLDFDFTGEPGLPPVLALGAAPPIITPVLPPAPVLVAPASPSPPVVAPFAYDPLPPAPAWSRPAPSLDFSGAPGPAPAFNIGDAPFVSVPAPPHRPRSAPHRPCRRPSSYRMSAPASSRRYRSGRAAM
jgi:hypothetical protein